MGIGDKHYHVYKRTNLTKNKKVKTYYVYKCTETGCVHYVPVSQAIGRVAKCPMCGDIYEIDKRSVRLASPHCNDCYSTNKDEELINTMKFIEELTEDLSDELE